MSDSASRHLDAGDGKIRVSVLEDKQLPVPDNVGDSLANPMNHLLHGHARYRDLQVTPYFPTGRLELAPRDPPRDPKALFSARVGEHTVSDRHIVIADDDGAVFLPDDRVTEILDVAVGIRDTERRQLSKSGAGTPFGGRFEFRSFPENKKQSASLTFREHPRALGGDRGMRVTRASRLSAGAGPRHERERRNRP